jgi:hypothetical protein
LWPSSPTPGFKIRNSTAKSVLTYRSGNKHALVRLASGERAIVSGGPGGIDFPRGAVSRVIAHTHPYGTGGP